MDDPEARDCAGTTVPDPFAAVSIFIFAGDPGVTVNGCTFDNPPPPSLNTVTGYTPETSKSLAGIDAINCDELI